MDRLTDRIVRDAGIRQSFHHWTGLWMGMPRLAYRLSYCMTDAVRPPGADPLLVSAFRDGAQVIDGWLSSTSTRDLVQDAVRAMFSRCLTASAIVVRVNSTPWSPDVDGPLAEVIARHPMAKIICSGRDGDTSPATMGLHRLLKANAYCDVCALTLRSSYEDLMGLKEPV